MTRIVVQTSNEGKAEVILHEDQVRWIELARTFGRTLENLGYHLPDDWHEYLDRKESQIDLRQSVFEEEEEDKEEDDGDKEVCITPQGRRALAEDELDTYGPFII
jgi:hypothetical protein